MVMLTLRFVHFTSLSESWESGSGWDGWLCDITLHDRSFELWFVL